MRKRIACVTAAILSISLGVSGCGLIPFEQDIPFLSSRAENVETEKKTEQQTIDEQDADTEKSTEDTQQDDGLNEGEQTANEDTEEADEKQENPMEQAALMAVQYDYIEEILPKEIAFVSTQICLRVSRITKVIRICRVQFRITKIRKPPVQNIRWSRSRTCSSIH